MTRVNDGGWWVVGGGDEFQQSLLCLRVALAVVSFSLPDWTASHSAASWDSLTAAWKGLRTAVSSAVNSAVSSAALSITIVIVVMVVIMGDD